MLRRFALSKSPRYKGLRLPGLLLGCLSLFGCILEGPLPEQGDIFEPAVGVTCDQERQICYDRQGPDVRLTRTYFGDIAAERLERQLANAEGSGHSIFEPEPGVSCNRATQICYDQQGPDVRLTRTYFGNTAANRLRRRGGEQGRGSQGGSHDEWYPQQEVRCERARQICFDREGADVALTRRYFGDDAAERLANQLRRQRPEQPGYGSVYEPQQGVACEASVQVCADRQGPDVHLTRRYFGDDAADRLIRQLNHRGPLFEPRSGVSCDRSQRLCYDRQGPDAHWTRLFFGEHAAQRLQRRSQ